MAGPREAVTYIPQGASDTGEDEIIPQISEDADLQEQFEEFFNRTRDIDSEVTVRVYRIPVDANGNPVTTGKMSFLFGSPLDAFTLDQMYERLKREFIRPGENSITVRMICTQKGIQGMRFNRVTSVERGADESKRFENSEPTVLSAVSKMLAEQQARTDSLFREFFARSQNPAPPPDPFAQLGALVTPFMPAIVAWIGKSPAGGGGGLNDALKAIATAKTLVSGAPPAADEDGDSLGGILKAVSPFAPVLQEIVKRLSPPPAGPAAPALPAPVAPPPPLMAVPVAPATQVPPAPAATPQNPTGGHSVLFLEIGKNLSQLADLVKVNGAENMDAKQIAGMVAQQLPEELPADADDLLFEGDAFLKLKQIAPKIGEHEAWFRAFLNELRAIYSDEGTPQ